MEVVEMFKNFMRTAAVGAMAGGLMFAQTPGTATTPAPVHKSGAMHHKRGRKRVNRKLLASYLGLTADQQARAKAIREQARSAAQPILAQLKENRSEMRAAIKAGQPVDQLAAARGALMGKLIGIRANAREQFRSILTPAQIQKLSELRG
jgi:Spy/CpxP family protein refolding chaperone